MPSQSRQDQERMLRIAARDAGVIPPAMEDAARRGLAKFAGITITDYEARDFMVRELKVDAPPLYGHGEAVSSQSQAGASAPAPPSPPRADNATVLASWQWTRPHHCGHMWELAVPHLPSRTIDFKGLARDQFSTST
jgi:hypothetical protein